MQRLWDEQEARDAAEAALRRSSRARKPRTFFGDSQFPSQSQDLSEEEVSDPEEDGCDPEEYGYTPLAVRRAPRARKPRKFFGDSQFPSQSQDDSKEQDEEEEEEEEEDKEDAAVEVSFDEEMENEGPARAPLSPSAEEDEEDDERVEAPAEEDEEEEDDEMWYVGGTQAFPDAPPGDSEEDADEDDDAAADDDDAPLPPMDDDDDDGRLNEAADVVRSKNSWTGPLPEIGCPKCRFAAKGCGRCRAIRAHAEFGTPLPWGGTVRVGTNVRGRGRSARAPTPAPRSASAKKRKGRSAPAASVRRVRFDDDAPGGRLTSIVPASAGKRRRLLAPAPGSSGRRRGRPPSFAAREALSSPREKEAIRRRRGGFPATSSVFSGMTFLLSGLPARDDVEELTRLIEDAGGTVCREVPPPAPETPPAALDFDAYAPSQDVGAPMRRSSVGRATRVVTPKPGRTLKCLYAAAVGAPMCTPEWVRASLDAGRPLSPARRPRARCSRAATRTTTGVSASEYSRGPW